MNKNFSKAERSLIKSDPRLGRIIENNGHLKFSNKKIDPFNELVNIVISQFISTKAAKGIKEKMLKKLNEESFTILSFKNLNVSQIKSLGLSKNKAKSIKSLELFFSQNPISKNLYRLSEEERYDNLIKIFGIGKWSIEMFEIFCVRNKNIFSGDTRYCEALEKSSKDADILVHEVFVGLDYDPVRMSSDTIENISDYHTTPEEIGVLASNASVKKLILNHFVPPVFDEDVLVERIAKHFDGEIVVGKDLMQFDI